MCDFSAGTTEYGNSRQVNKTPPAPACSKALPSVFPDSSWPVAEALPTFAHRSGSNQSATREGRYQDLSPGHELPFRLQGCTFRDGTLIFSIKSRPNLPTAIRMQLAAADAGQPFAERDATMSSDTEGAGLAPQVITAALVRRSCCFGCLCCRRLLCLFSLP